MKSAGLRRCWDRAAVYLPVLTMGLLALGSYWVLRSTAEPPPAAAPRAVRHEPDYFMRGFSVRSHQADGALRSELSGSQAQHYPDDDTTQVEQARLRAYGAKGLLTRAESERLTTNASQSEYLLEGRVKVERGGAIGADGQAQGVLRFEGEQLRVYENGQRIASDLPVELSRGGQRIQAQTLRYDDDTRVAELKGRVRALLSPR